MKFALIIDYLKQGKKVRRASWNKSLYIEQSNGNVKLCIEGPNCTKILDTTAHFSYEDVIAEDWGLFEKVQ